MGSFLALIYCAAGPKVANLVTRGIGGPELITLQRWRAEEPRLLMGTSDGVVAHNWDMVVWPTLVELGLDDCLLGLGALRLYTACAARAHTKGDWHARR